MRKVRITMLIDDHVNNIAVTNEDVAKWYLLILSAMLQKQDNYDIHVENVEVIK